MDTVLIAHCMEEMISSSSYGEAKVAVLGLGYRLGREKAELCTEKNLGAWREAIKLDFKKKGFCDISFSFSNTSQKKFLSARLAMLSSKKEYCSSLWPWFFSGWLSGYSSTFFEKKFIFHPVFIPDKKERPFVFEGKEQKEWKAVGEKYITDYEFFHGGKFVARSLPMRMFMESICLMAPSELPVYLEARYEDSPAFFARYLHFHSSRTREPFVHFEVSNLDEQLFKSAIRSATKGSLYISSVELLLLSFQEYLVNILENVKAPSTPRLILHGEKPLSIYVEEKKIIPALAKLLQKGAVFMPEINKRVEDIIFYSKYYLKRLAPKDSMQKLSFSPAVFSEFIQYDWTGGVRELEAIIRSMLVRKGEIGSELEAEHLPEHFRKKNASKLTTDFPEGSLESIEKRAIEGSLKKAHGNKKEAARILGIGYNSLWRKLNSYTKSESESTEQ